MREFHNYLSYGLSFQIAEQVMLLARIQVKSTLIEKIKTAQEVDTHLQQIRESLEHYTDREYHIDGDGLLRRHDRIVIPMNSGLRHALLERAHVSSYTIHPGITKMYHDLKNLYWWEGMKKDIAEYVMRCLTC